MEMLRDFFWVLHQPRHWMARDKWDALVAGEPCPICADVKQPQSDFGFLVAQLEVANLILPKNQYARGYCLLTYREHATEIHLLPPSEQMAYFRDLARAGAAIAQVFRPTKMNYQILGNLVPHLHCHIIPRYWGDPAPGRPLNTNAGWRTFKTDKYHQVVSDLQRALV